MEYKRLLKLISALGIFIVIVISFYVIINQAGINADETVSLPYPVLPTIDDLSTLSTGQIPNMQGKRYFPDDPVTPGGLNGNYWNWDISNAPVDPNSDEYINHIWTNGNAPLHPDFGPVYGGMPNGAPYNVVSGDQPRVQLKLDGYPSESDKGYFPIPDNLAIQGTLLCESQLVGYGPPNPMPATCPAAAGDRHASILDKDNHLLYELYSARKTSDGWVASNSAIWDLNSTAMWQRPIGWTSSDGAGMPYFAGLVTYDDAVYNGIHHALRFTVQHIRAAWTPPASHIMSYYKEKYLLPAGARFRLKASVDVSQYPKEVQNILNALKKYGMIVADQGGQLYLSGAPDMRWNDPNINQMKKITAKDFEVVKIGPINVSYPAAQASVPTASSTLLAKLGGTAAGDIFTDGWDKVVIATYDKRTTDGPGGISYFGGDSAYTHSGVTGKPHTFKSGDQIIVTFYYNPASKQCPSGGCPDTLIIDSAAINLIANNNRNPGGDSRFWAPLSSGTVARGDSIKLAYTFTEGLDEQGIKAGDYSMVIVSGGKKAAWLVIDKIEYGQATITDSTPMVVDLARDGNTYTKDYLVAREGKHDINVIGEAGDYSLAVDGGTATNFTIPTDKAGSSYTAAKIQLTTGPHKFVFSSVSGAVLSKFQATSAAYTVDPNYPIEKYYYVANPTPRPASPQLGSVTTPTPTPVPTPTPTPTPVPTPTSVPTSTPIAVNNPPPVSTPTPIPVSNPTPESTPPSSLSSPVSEPAPAVDPPSIVSSVATTVSNVVSAVVETITSVFSPSVETPLIVPSTPNSTQFGAPTYPTITKDLTYRSRDTQVTKVNEILAFVGYSTNPNTNYFSLTTRNSLRTFQRRNGMYKIGKKIDPEYGIVGSKTRAALNRYISEIEDTKLNPENHIPVYLRYGQRGGGALALNRTLRKLGYLKNGEVYVFNSRTRAALQTFQKANNLKKTTKLNSETLNKLREAVK